MLRMEAMKDFMQAIIDENFVEGHELLEDIWREWKNNPKKREESFILKGFINGSTALALKVMGRDEPSKKVWQTYEKYRPLIASLPSSYTNIYKEAETLLDTKYKKIMSK